MRRDCCGAEALRLGLAWRWTPCRTPRRWLALRSVVGSLGWQRRRGPRGRRCRRCHRSRSCSCSWRSRSRSRGRSRRRRRSRSRSRSRSSKGRWGARLGRCYWRERLVFSRHVNVRVVVGWSRPSRLPLRSAGLRGILDLCACGSSTSKWCGCRNVLAATLKRCLQRSAQTSERVHKPARRRVPCSRSLISALIEAYSFRTPAACSTSTRAWGGGGTQPDPEAALRGRALGRGRGLGFAPPGGGPAPSIVVRPVYAATATTCLLPSPGARNLLPAAVLD